LVEAAEYGFLEFRDFDGFRESLRGWDTDPIQLSPGSLRIQHEFRRLGALRLTRIRTNRALSDTSAVRPGNVVFVVTLAPHHFCGAAVTSGSLVVHEPGREHRNVLPVAWESIEFTASVEALRDLALPCGEAGPGQLAPDRSTFSLSPDVVIRVRTWADRVLPRRGPLAAANGHQATETPPPASEVEEDLVTEILPSILGEAASKTIGEQKPTGAGRQVGYELVEKAIRLAEPSDGPGADIDAIAGTLTVSRRTLEFAFRGALGCSPAWYFRARRLARVRREILRGGSVTDAAVRHRFVSLGRFSALYRRQFGELPSATRSRRS
jgi:AraC family ethanolamine operon transcriptional activator